MTRQLWGVMLGYCWPWTFSFIGNLQPNFMFGKFWIFFDRNLPPRFCCRGVIQYKLNMGLAWKVLNNQQRCCCHKCVTYISVSHVRLFVILRKTSCSETSVMGWLQRNQIRKKYATWSSNGRRLQLYNHTNRSGYSYTAGCHPFFFSWSKLLKFPFFIKWDTVCKNDYKRKMPKSVFSVSLITV